MRGPGPLPPIVCGVDDGYVLPLRVLMRSIAAAHPEAVDQLRLIVLDQGISPGNRRALLADAGRLGLATQLRPIPAPDPVYPVSGWVSDAVYARLSIPDVVTEAERVLYLDVDTVVLADLRPLLGLPLAGCPLGAVLDAQNPLVGPGTGMPGWRALGLPWGREYFNSGVMLLDLAACRELGLFERARRFLVEHPDKVRYWDQDALNHAADDNWLRLEPRWNSVVLSALVRLPGFAHHAEEVNPLARLVAAERTAAVLHFAGAAKPWKDGYPAGYPRETYRGFLAGVKTDAS